MPLDPTISLQAGRPPTGSEAGAGGNNLMGTNLLANPAALNQLMQMGGNMAAGRAVNAAMDPDSGTINIEQAIRNVTKDPLTAPVALKAIGEIQSLANAQYSRTRAQNDEAKTILAGLMEYGDKLTEDHYVGAIKSGFQRGLIPKELAAALSSQMPVDPTTMKFDPVAGQANVQQMLLQRLSGPEQAAAVNGSPITVSDGVTSRTIMLSPLRGVMPRVVTTTTQQLSIPEGQALQPGPVGPKGEQTLRPVGAAPQVPRVSAPIIGPDGKPLPGSGTTPAAINPGVRPADGYQPQEVTNMKSFGKDVARMKKYFDGLPKDRQQVVGEWLAKQTK